MRVYTVRPAVCKRIHHKKNAVGTVHVVQTQPNATLEDAYARTYSQQLELNINVFHSLVFIQGMQLYLLTVYASFQYG